MHERIKPDGAVVAAGSNYAVAEAKLKSASKRRSTPKDDESKEPPKDEPKSEAPKSEPPAPAAASKPEPPKPASK